MEAKTFARKKKAAIPPAPKFGLAELAEVNRRSIKSAGPRYFPDCHMEIESFDEAIAGLVGGDEFRALVEDIKQGIEKGRRDAFLSMESDSDYRDKLPEPKGVLRALDELMASAPGRGAEAIAKIRQRAGRAHKKADALWNRIHRAREKKIRESGHLPSRDSGSAVVSYKNALGRAMNFMPGQSVAGKDIHMLANACGLHQSGTLVLRGEWGMGKTHSLCDLAKKQGGKGLPVLLTLAKDLNLGPNGSPGDALALHTGLADDFDGLLQRLNMLGRKAGVRALLLVDGVNENNPDGVWERELRKMLKRVRFFPFVGLVVSYRTPFRHGLSESELLETPHMWHEGFREIPLEAQAAFLKYYDVPLPEVPPMAEEFTRPLTLKIICEIFKELPEKERDKGFDGIASGQKGMTFILERYIKKRAAAVSKKRGNLSPQAVWILVKDEIAPYLADNLTEEMPAMLLLKSMRKRFSVGGLKARRILRDMAKENVIIMRRGILWEWRKRGAAPSSPKKPRWRAIVQMPYQRFGDHLVARHLLREHLDTKSADAVRRSFRANRPLGRTFAPEKNRHEFRPTSLGSGPAEALILEFPERVKNTPGIPAGERELLFYLPRWREKYGAYRGPFLSGLYWRANAAFSKQTEMLLLGGYLRNWEDAVTRDPRYYHYGEPSVTNILLSLACKRASPIPARRLCNYVKSMKMPDRDVLWGTAMRGARTSDWTRNLFTWLSALEQGNFSPAVARNYVVLLSLFLGSTDRPLRDKATEALVAIGERFPATLFSHALDTLDFDDIYYPERMLAACYGVAMARWSDPKAKEFQDEFPQFARAIVKNIFMPGGRLLTHHALVRDYALGIADVARRLGVKFTKSQETHMSPPFPAVRSPFRPASKIDEEKLSSARSTFTPDFHEWYTVPRIARNLGSMMPSAGLLGSVPSGNFKNISRQIKRRVVDLGFSDEKFGALDRRIADDNRRGEAPYGKVDRCGKKYSWIAYHEMFGLLGSRNQLPERAWEESMDARDAEGVLDPSFPVPPPEWDPGFRTPPMDGDDLPWLVDSPAPDYGRILELDNAGDAPGPWVMLEGFAIHKNATGRREVFSFLRGLLVRESDIPRLRAALGKCPYPGNHEIPHCAENDNVFSGEIPWSPKFAHSQADEDKDMAFGAVPMETTAVHNGGNEHHGERFRFSAAWFPAPDICAKLRLSRRGRGVDLVDERGRAASLYRADARKLKPDPFAGGPNDEFQFLHLRKDLLDEYLRATGKRLVWVVWGERRPLQDWRNLKDVSPKIKSAVRNHLHIHKRLIVCPK